MQFATCAVALTFAAIAALASAQKTANAADVRFQIATTVSPEAAAGLRAIYETNSLRRGSSIQVQAPVDWDRQSAHLEEMIRPLIERAVEPMKATASEDKLGGVPVLRVKTPEYEARTEVLVYVHGGGYVLFSARTSLVIPALMARATGNEVISIDYTLAPHGSWRSITDQVLAVYQALLTKGYKAQQIGLLGDSAGGGLAAGAVLKMRDQGIPLPGALYLIAPWSDITASGDSYLTLVDADPQLNVSLLASAANAYASPADQKHPYVSPVYGDYSKPFPPTLIQGGTREIFLSHMVRHYQAIRAGGHEAVLDLYEGMPHVFQSLVPASSESQTAIRRAAQFFEQHLPPSASTQ